MLPEALYISKGRFTPTAFCGTAMSRGVVWPNRDHRSIVVSNLARKPYQAGIAFEKMTRRRDRRGKISKDFVFLPRCGTVLNKWHGGNGTAPKAVPCWHGWPCMAVHRRDRRASPWRSRRFSAHAQSMSRRSRRRPTQCQAIAAKARLVARAWHCVSR